MAALEEMGIPVEQWHPESAPGEAGAQVLTKHISLHCVPFKGA